MRPCSRIDSVSSASSCSSKYCRGCPAWGTIFSIGQMKAAALRGPARRRGRRGEERVEAAAQRAARGLGSWLMCAGLRASLCGAALGPLPLPRPPPVASRISRARLR